MLQFMLGLIIGSALSAFGFAIVKARLERDFDRELDNINKRRSKDGA